MRADQHGHRALRRQVQGGQGVPLRSPSAAKGGTRRFLGAGSHAMGAEARDTLNWGRVERLAVGRTEGPSREVPTYHPSSVLYLCMARLRRMSAVVVLRAACRLVAGRHARLRRRARRASGVRCSIHGEELPADGPISRPISGRISRGDRPRSARARASRGDSRRGGRGPGEAAAGTAWGGGGLDWCTLTRPAWWGGRSGRSKTAD